MVAECINLLKTPYIQKIRKNGYKYKIVKINLYFNGKIVY